MTRAMIVNGAQLGTYSRVKIMWKDTGVYRNFNNQPIKDQAVKKHEDYREEHKSNFIAFIQKRF